MSVTFLLPPIWKAEEDVPIWPIGFFPTTLYISCIVVIWILLIVCVELKTKYMLVWWNWFIIQIFFLAKNLEFRYMVLKINSEQAPVYVVYLMFMRKVKLCIERNPFDGLLHNFIYWCTLTSGKIAKFQMGFNFYFYDSIYNWIASHLFLSALWISHVAPI